MELKKITSAILLILCLATNSVFATTENAPLKEHEQNLDPVQNEIIEYDIQPISDNIDTNLEKEKSVSNTIDEYATNLNDEFWQIQELLFHPESKPTEQIKSISSWIGNKKERKEKTQIKKCVINFLEIMLYIP